MADGREIVFLYTDSFGNDFYAVADVAQAWHDAGRPPINEAWRSRQRQLRMYLDPTLIADNPDDPSRPRVHMRACGLDIDPTPTRVRKLEAAGLVRPYSYEPWHWQPRDWAYYPIIPSLPANVRSIDPAAPVPTLPITKDEIMAGPVYLNVINGPRAIIDYNLPRGHFLPRSDDEAFVASKIFDGRDVSQHEYNVALNLSLGLRDAFLAPLTPAEEVKSTGPKA